MKTFILWLEGMDADIVKFAPNVIKIAKENPSATPSKIASLARASGFNIGNSAVAIILKQYKKEHPELVKPTPQPAQPTLTPQLAPKPQMSNREYLLKYIDKTGVEGLTKLGYALSALVAQGVMSDINDYNAIDFNALDKFMSQYVSKNVTPDSKLKYLKAGLAYRKDGGIAYLPQAAPALSPIKYYGREFTKGEKIPKGFQVNSPEEEAFPTWTKLLDTLGQ